MELNGPALPGAALRSCVTSVCQVQPGDEECRDNIVSFARRLAPHADFEANLPESTIDVQLSDPGYEGRGWSPSSRRMRS